MGNGEWGMGNGEWGEDTILVFIHIFTRSTYVLARGCGRQDVGKDKDIIPTAHCPLPTAHCPLPNFCRKGKPAILSRLKGAVWAVAIALLSATLALWIAWRVPGLGMSASDWLMRRRGPLPVPDDIVIVAIDEPSLKRVGPFPWRRSYMAPALDYLKTAQPKAIRFDVLYIEETTKADDAALASAVKRAGNVVVAAQLTAGATSEDPVEWLRPLPDIESSAAGVGHVDVHTGFDGVARTLLLREADDQGAANWAMAVELIRVGDGLAADALRALPQAVAIGNRILPVTIDPDSELIESTGAGSERLRVERLSFDYIGPSGSFAPQTISFSEV